MARAVKMVNGFGKVRWQPETSNGLREYDTGWYNPNPNGKKRPIPHNSEPVLYRKEKMAIWNAQAQEDIAYFQVMNKFTEVA